MLKEEAKRRMQMLEENYCFNGKALKLFDKGAVSVCRWDSICKKLTMDAVLTDGECAKQISYIEEEYGAFVYFVFEITDKRYFLVVEDDPFAWEDDPFERGWFFTWVGELDGGAPYKIQLINISTKDGGVVIRGC